MDNRPRPMNRKPPVVSRKSVSLSMIIAMVVLSLATFAVGYALGRNKSQNDVNATLFTRSLGSINNSGVTLQMLEEQRVGEIKRFQEAVLKRAAKDAHTTKAFLDPSRISVPNTIESCNRARDYAQRQGLTETAQQLRDIRATLGP